MTSIFFIHPSVSDVKSFLTFTCLDGVVEPESLEWNSENPDILFASEWVYYRKDYFRKFSALYSKAKLKVAWMGEAVSADFNIFDYAVGFDNNQTGNKRFIRTLSPFDMYYRFLPERSNPITDARSAEALFQKKGKFCNFLYSNPDAHPMRDRLFYVLDAFKRVDSLGKHLNNTAMPGTGYKGHYKEATLLKNPYRFSIASENAEYDGYTSEKIFTSLAAHTVPVYWGNPSVCEDVNPECFINVRDFNSLEEMVKYVAQVEGDPKLWASIVSKPWLTPAQEQSHRERTENYRRKMAELLEGKLSKAVPEGYHINLYRKQFFSKKFSRKSWKGKAHRLLEILSPVLTDRTWIILKYRLVFGKKPDLKNPHSFNEKIQAAKLNDRNPLYTTLVDKAAVKEYVAARVGSEFVIPTLGVWDDFGSIDFDSLPSGFVLKCTHDSGSVVVVRDKENFDRKKAEAKLGAALRRDFSLISREWPYRNVPRRIIAELYIKNLEGCTDDYKFFCTNGRVRFLFVATGRSGGDAATRFDYFDPLWNHLPVTNGHPNAEKTPVKPDNFEEMLSLVGKLSEGLPFVRVDIYNIDGQILFGEYTFSHWGGFKPFDPPEWDVKLGEMLSAE